jgi:hypothetical protein
MNKWDLAQKAMEEARAAGKLPDSPRSAGISPAHSVRQSTASSLPMRRRGPKKRVDRRLQPGARSVPEGKLNPETLLTNYEKIVRAKLKFLDYAPIIFLSALTGERTGKLFSLIDQVAAARVRRVTTGEMNRWLAQVDLGRGTSPAGREMKIFYITQASVAPPTFVLFTNQARPMHFSYQRFLENRLRAHFDFTGTPIRFNIRLKKR